MSVATTNKEISLWMAVRQRRKFVFTAQNYSKSNRDLISSYRQIQLEEDERRMVREQTVLGKFMYKCGTLKSPRTKSDFEKLLANVQKWKATEVGSGIKHWKSIDLFTFFSPQTMRIQNLYKGDNASKSLAFKQLLGDEIKLINEIRAKRQRLLNNQQNNKTEKILDRLGAPVKWAGYKSKKWQRLLWLAEKIDFSTDIGCEMDLLRTQKTRQLTALYRQLKSTMEKNNRVEFITRLSDVLKKETASIVLDAVKFIIYCEKKSSNFLITFITI